MKSVGFGVVDCVRIGGVGIGGVGIGGVAATVVY